MRRIKEDLKPLKQGEITMYSCGPTVYWRAHSGNHRAYTAWDVLSRYLRYQGYTVKRIINFTDVGHMTHDEDFGDDKIDSQAKSENKTPLEVANHYIKTVLVDFAKMNIQHPNGTQIDPDIDPSKLTKDDWGKLGWARATDYIQEMIELVKKMEANGFTYETDQAVYFDVTKYIDYTKLSRQDLSEKEVGVREEVNVDPNKRHPADFVLWMKLAGRYKDHVMNWDSPWGKGFPGWHIECSAMGWKNFGEYFDMHTGGVDHINVHHSNEIAQNFGAFKHDVVTYWLHNEMLVSKEGDKLSKSKKNVYLLEELAELGYQPLDLRYYFLTVNYRMAMPFSLEGMDGAKNSRLNLISRIAEIIKKSAVFGTVSDSSRAGGTDTITKAQLVADGKIIEEYRNQFVEAMDDNLNTSKALSVLSVMIKNNDSVNSVADVLATIDDFDSVFGLDLIESAIAKLSEAHEEEIPTEIIDLVERRSIAKKNRDFAEADRIRAELSEKGYSVVDDPSGNSVAKRIG